MLSGLVEQMERDGEVLSEAVAVSLLVAAAGSWDEADDEMLVVEMLVWLLMAVSISRSICRLSNGFLLVGIVVEVVCDIFVFFVLFGDGLGDIFLLPSLDFLWVIAGV